MKKGKLVTTLTFWILRECWDTVDEKVFHAVLKDDKIRAAEKRTSTTLDGTWKHTMVEKVK